MTVQNTICCIRVSQRNFGFTWFNFFHRYFLFRHRRRSLFCIGHRTWSSSTADVVLRQTPQLRWWLSPSHEAGLGLKTYINKTKVLPLQFMAYSGTYYPRMADRWVALELSAVDHGGRVQAIRKIEKQLRHIVRNQLLWRVGVIEALGNQICTYSCIKWIKGSPCGYQKSTWDDILTIFTPQFHCFWIGPHVQATDLNRPHSRTQASNRKICNFPSDKYILV